MKILFAFFLLIASAQAQLLAMGKPQATTWTYVGTANAACTASATCAITYALGAGHVAIVSLVIGGTASVTIDSITNGGSWTPCCSTGGGGVTSGTTFAYNLNTSSASSVTVNWTGSQSFSWVAIAEYSWTGATPTFDTTGTPLVNQTACSGACATGVALTLAGSDVVFQTIVNGAGCANITGPGAPYTTPSVAPTSGIRWAGAINLTGTPAAPVFTQSGSCAYTVDAIALK